MTTDHDDPLDDAFESLRTATPPVDSYAAVRSAQRDSAALRTTSRLARPAARPVALAIAVLAVAGTATAAVTESGPFSTLETSATTDGPAARNLGVLLKALDGLPQVPGPPRDSGAAPSGDPTVAEGGTVRGTTVTRDGVSVDVALDDTRICLAPAGPRTPPRRRSTADAERALPPIDEAARTTDRVYRCVPRADAHRTLPAISGTADGRPWVAVVVPDDVSGLTVASGGRTAAPTVIDNVAIAVLPGEDAAGMLSWLAPNGTRLSQSLSGASRSATPSVRPLERR
jgi:hypothetical protein